MSYSCNDNQNYFVSEGRTTSRVLNPPGGASSFTLGMPTPPAPTPAVNNNNKPAPNSQQQQQLSAVEEGPKKEDAAVIGAEEAKVESVLDAPVAETTEQATPSNPASTAPQEPDPQTTTTSTPPKPLLPGESSAPVSSNAFASGANMNGANVMTGRPTSRVLAPPGGHSACGGSLW